MFSQTNDLQKAIDQVNNSDNKDTNFDSIKDQLGVPPMPPTDGPGVPPMPAPFTADAAPVEGAPEATPDGAAPADAPAAPADVPVPEAPAETPAPENIAPDASASPAEESPAEPVNVTVGTPDLPPAQEAQPEAQEAPAAPEAASTDAPSAESILSGDNDLNKVREDVLRDLMPLMDKVQSDPEQKFEIYKDAMETLHDKGLVSGAYKVASQITDENKKAESLMDLMRAIDTLK